MSQNKGGLISESLSLWPYLEHYSPKKDAQDSDLAHFLGDLSQIGKLSGIKQFKRTKYIFSKAPSTKKIIFPSESGTITFIIYSHSDF